MDAKITPQRVVIARDFTPIRVGYHCRAPCHIRLTVPAADTVEVAQTALDDIKHGGARIFTLRISKRHRSVSVMN